jgi:molybdate transport system regulatory protein
MAGHKGSKYYNIFLEHQIRLVSGDITVINEEGFRLLIEIGKDESIVAAAKKLKISYRKAWGMLRDIERSLGFSIAGKHRGGKDGGKTSFTPEGRELLNAYNDLINELQASGKDSIRNFFRRINSIQEQK